MKKVLIDECLPRRLIRDLHHYHVSTVPQRGWAGKKDSELLELASAEFDVFVTLDSNLAFQQNVSLLSLGIVVMHVKSSRYESLQPLIPSLVSTIENSVPGTVSDIG
ncbi:DUF5615 family PIN-like protein [Pontiella sulfatireligans]|uniref:DUF5615 domain-containing protein n=1 Tax=Pontiella sulfatireligans TaxID=2750658 RepID=A0A6C2UTC8_9BACT|nr:DUF5615 family PIN-like protein [Pontiella sulfatireligans]VGO22521.1 hypothetical protein SCARR_04605 [Pontiella sulfatireligans]